MTNNDEQVLRLLAEMGAETDPVEISATDLADVLDLSESTALRVIRRLTESGRLEVIHTPGRRSGYRVPGGDERGHDRGQPYTHPPTGGVGGCTDDPDRGQDRASPTRRPKPKNQDEPGPARADPDCPRCEGTGWQFTSLEKNVVAPCICRGDGVSAHIHHLQRRSDQTWGSPPVVNTGPPAKSDYAEVWRQYARRQLDGGAPADPSA